MKSKTSLVLILICLNAANLFAQGNSTSQLAKYFSALAENRYFTGNVLIAEKGKIVYQGSFGYANRRTKRLNALSTQFPICSITKTFVATSILQLQERGKLDVADPVTKYLPDFPYKDVTIKQLLSHTSGLPEFYGTFDSLAAKYPHKLFRNNDLIDSYRAVNQTLLFQPGENFAYNNANYVVLSVIVSAVSHSSISAYIFKNILEPAGMRHTFMSDYLHLSPAIREKSDIAVPDYHPYLYSEESFRTDSIPYIIDDAKHFNFSGFGDMISTVRDLLLYDNALYSGKLLKPETMRQAFTPVNLNNGKPNPGVWGLGWQIDEPGKMVNHGGGMAGMYLSFTRDIEKQRTAIVFSIGHEELSRPVALNAIKILGGRQLVTPKKSAAFAYGLLLTTSGREKADRFIETVVKDTLTYELSESEMNALGYDLLGGKFVYHLSLPNRLAEALEAFKKTIQLFPESWNAYDSYGEALAKAGRKEEAILMYEKSIRLNPKNEGGKKALDALKRQS